MLFGFFKRPIYRQDPFGSRYNNYAEHGVATAMEGLRSLLQDNPSHWHRLHPEDQIWYAGWHDWTVRQLRDYARNDSENQAFVDWRIRELGVVLPLSPKARKIKKRQLEQREKRLREIERTFRKKDSE